jgi:hypothetical protein
VGIGEVKREIGGVRHITHIDIHTKINYQAYIDLLNAAKDSQGAGDRDWIS